MKPKNESVKLRRLQDKIVAITSDKAITSTYKQVDESVQAELRLSAVWKITLPVDHINYPKELDPRQPGRDLWGKMHSLQWDLYKAAELSVGHSPLRIIKISSKTKEGPAKRKEATTAWLIESATAFIAAYRKATSRSNIAKTRKTIAALQDQQKELIPQMRESNSRYLSSKKIERENAKARNAEALKSGRFWEADHETIKGYFHPPFDKNYVADVSEKWRACLVLECASVSWRNYNKDWRHKLAGTGRGYLCGIDDNGDEWGYVVRGLPQPRDHYDNRSLDTTVEEAMAMVFGVDSKKIPNCYRQGDLLFCPESIPATSEMVSCAKWEPRESHVISSPGMERNGTYFRSAHEITVTHTSHPTLVLSPQEYRVYLSHSADDAD